MHGKSLVSTGDEITNEYDPFAFKKKDWTTHYL